MRACTAVVWVRVVVVLVLMFLSVRQLSRGVSLISGGDRGVKNLSPLSDEENNRIQTAATHAARRAP